MRSGEKKSTYKEGRDMVKRRGMVREDLNRGKERMRKSVSRCK